MSADRRAVLALVKEAFSGDGRDGHEEVEIVERTWEVGDPIRRLDLVAAEDDGLLVGHVLAAPGRLRCRETGNDTGAPAGRSVLAVAPLAVLPSRQRQGVGSSLMREVLSRAQSSGAPMVVLLGHPTYYPRFGFEPADAYGIAYDPVGFGNPAFMVRPFVPLGDGWRGSFMYCWEDPQ